MIHGHEQPSGVPPRGSSGITVTANAMPLWKPYKVEVLQAPDPKTGIKKIRMTYGPYDLKPASFKRPSSPNKMDPNSDQFTGIITGLPTGSMILETNSTLTYADGSIADVVNGVYIHHLIVFDQSKTTNSPIKCLNNGTTTPDLGLLMGASEANRDLVFKSASKLPTAFKVDKNDVVMLSAEIVNYKEEPKKVFSVSDIEYIEGVNPDTIHTSLHVFDVLTCNPNTVNLAAPHGKSKYTAKSQVVQIQKDGFILTSRGHMHDGGESVNLLLNGKIICKSIAIYGGNSTTTTIDGKKWSTISKMESCSKPVRVKIGDLLEVTADFDLDKYPP
jgi:hypothetical protein